MTQASEIFVSWIKTAVAALGLPEPKVLEDRYMFKVQDRWIEFKFNSSRRQITIASLLLTRSEEEPLRNDLIADFNAFHLFRGGFALVPVDRSLLYFCRDDRLENLDPGAIRALLEDFLNRADSVAAWYFTESRKLSTSAQIGERNSEGAFLRA